MAAHLATVANLAKVAKMRVVESLSSPQPQVSDIADRGAGAL
jgi:hypothetical protein